MKRIFVSLITLTILSLTFIACGSNDKTSTEPDEEIIETSAETNPPIVETETELPETELGETEPPETVPIPEETESPEIETVAETETSAEKADMGFNVQFSRTFRGDTTGRWRLAKFAENIDITEVAVAYYDAYFESDDEIHIVINFTLKTTNSITKIGNELNVTVLDYVDGEEHDASVACSGTVLADYYIDIDTGEVEEL